MPSLILLAITAIVIAIVGYYTGTWATTPGMPLVARLGTGMVSLTCLGALMFLIVMELVHL